MSLEIQTAEQTGQPMQKSSRLKRRLLLDLTTGHFRPGAILPSQDSLAERFGVSRPTVRRVLTEMEQEGFLRREKRQTYVSENVQQRIQKKTGFFALVSNATHDISTLSLIRGFERQCRKTQHNMLLFDSENDFGRQGELILRLTQMNDVAGVAMVPITSPPTPAYHASALQNRGIPVIFCHRASEEAQAPSLAIPREQQGRLVGRAFAEHGHRRVAMLIGYKTEGLKEMWMRGIRDTLHDSGGELPDEFVYSCEATSLDPREHEAELCDAMKRMLSAERPPTGIFSPSDIFAQTIYFALNSMGLRVPEDISLIGIGDANRKTAFSRRLTSGVNDGEQLAEQAVELLSEMRSGKRDLYNSETITVPISLYEGQTLGPAP